MFNRNFIYLALFFIGSIFLVACGGGDKTSDSAKETTEAAPKAKSMLKEKVDPMKDTGIGPVSELTLPAEIDEALAKTGKDLFKKKCTACHKSKKKFIGPAPKGIFERRNPAWVMNMILNPEEMVQKNAIAKALLIEYNGSPMANQSLTEAEARSVLEYFRTL